MRAIAPEHAPRERAGREGHDEYHESEGLGSAKLVAFL
jgi:hypothetical protein